MATFGRARAPRQQSGALRPFLALLAASLLLLLIRDADPVRVVSGIATGVLVPVQRVLSDTGAGVGRFFSAIGEIDSLRTDNARLRADVDRLTLENVQLREEAIAAQQAAKLDTARRGLPYEAVSAAVIGRDPSAVLQSILIAAGEDAGVRVGHIVVSDQGVVGRITQVGPTYSKALLVTDSGSSVSALVQGSRATGIVRGQYGDGLVMEWVLQTEPLRVGDVVVTAGLALGSELRSLYPKGLVIGRVVDVKRTDNAAYQRAVLVPAVDLRRLENVLVVKTPDN